MSSYVIFDRWINIYQNCVPDSLPSLCPHPPPHQCSNFFSYPVWTCECVQVALYTFLSSSSTSHEPSIHCWTSLCSISCPWVLVDFPCSPGQCPGNCSTLLPNSVFTVVMFVLWNMAKGMVMSAYWISFLS